MQTSVDLPEGSPPQQLAKLQAAQQRLLALAQHARQVLHCAGVAVVGPACRRTLQTPEHHLAMQQGPVLPSAAPQAYRQVLYSAGVAVMR